jgi:AcrR family transcriptional regulator
MPERESIILNKFEKLFNEIGYKSTTVERVAKELNMSKKTIYKYVNSKDHAYQIIIENYALKEITKIQQDIKPIKKQIDKLEYMHKLCFKNVYAAIQDNNNFAFHLPNKINIDSFQKAYKQTVIDILEYGNKIGEFNIDNINLCQDYIELIVSHTVQNLNKYESIDIEKLSFMNIKKLLV